MAPVIKRRLAVEGAPSGRHDAGEKRVVRLAAWHDERLVRWQCSPQAIRLFVEVTAALMREVSTVIVFMPMGMPMALLNTLMVR
ncbi:hypothetical protein HSBAA_PA_0510 (plasmid) [Vreelandella sulfidaeris]|uniref:Uncharacterized protein n=1 Tax=Vreelandella sulfidaeris TaxID=115553 RepID=A0A455UM90_9GAMM|nr:hypothetical protein HSBAA_PA_0510 [Halomonas sulfidaeris]